MAGCAVSKTMRAPRVPRGSLLAAGAGVDPDDVQRGWRGNPQALSLTDREMVDPLMLADEMTGGVFDAAGEHCFRRPPGYDGGVVVVGDETDLLAVALVGHGQALGPRQLTHLGLAQVAKREHRVRQLRLREGEQEVGLVLRGVNATQQAPAPGRLVLVHTRVVPGGDLVA